MARLGRAYVGAGNRPEALRIVARMEARPGDLGYALNAAILHIGLGNHDRAFALMEQALEERDFSMPNVITWLPYFDPLRADPRFTRLLERLGLN